MAAKFEVCIVSGNYLSIQLCQAIFPHVGKIQFSGTCTVWDSWQPTKEIIVSFRYRVSIDRSVYKYFGNAKFDY